MSVEMSRVVPTTGGCSAGRKCLGTEQVAVLDWEAVVLGKGTHKFSRTGPDGLQGLVGS